MVRLGPVAFVLISLPAMAWSRPPAGPENFRPRQSFQLPLTSDRRFDPDGAFGRMAIAPNAHFGFGMFGLKREKTHLQPVTGREIDTRKQRRAAIGFSVRF